MIYPLIYTQMNELLKFTPWQNTDTLVSLGSGSGWWEINAVIHRPAKELILIDQDFSALNDQEISESISYFENNINKKNTTNIRFKNDDVHTLTLESETADLVLIFNALHEFKEIPLVLKEAFRILKKEGHLFIEEEVSFTTPLIHEGCGKKLFFTEELIYLLSQSGFEMVDKIQKDPKAFYLLFKKK
jgi:ubiquinone/menaquinone biosynthesis C-methylase UbiE